MQKELTPDAAKLDELEALAKAARPGPYAVERRDIDCGYFDYIVHSDKGDVAWCREELDRKAKANAAYLSTLDPATVLSLVAEVRRARRLESESSPEAKRIKSQLAYLHDLGVRVVTPDGHQFALLDGSIDHIACETGWEEST